jgi:hypothetical protein
MLNGWIEKYQQRDIQYPYRLMEHKALCALEPLWQEKASQLLL